MRNLVCLFKDHSKCKGRVMEVATRGREPAVPCCEHHHTKSVAMSKAYSPTEWHKQVEQKDKEHDGPR